MSTPRPTENRSGVARQERNAPRAPLTTSWARPTTSPLSPAMEHTAPYLRPFDLALFEHSENQHAFPLTNWTPKQFPTERLLHYLVKPRNTHHLTMGAATPLENHVKESLAAAEAIGIHTRERYVYLTADFGLVEPNSTLRTPGWHCDGLQGDEVPVKKGSDFMTLWSAAIPTEYVIQPFDMHGVDISVHNIFNALALQVGERQVRQMRANCIYRCSSYLVHRSAVVAEPVQRRFVRVSVSHIPVTSVKMTPNPDIEYGYLIHTTTGEIPAHLA